MVGKTSYIRHACIGQLLQIARLLSRNRKSRDTGGCVVLGRGREPRCSRSRCWRWPGRPARVPSPGRRATPTRRRSRRPRCCWRPTRRASGSRSRSRSRRRRVRRWWGGATRAALRGGHAGTGVRRLAVLPLAGPVRRLPPARPALPRPADRDVASGAIGMSVSFMGTPIFEGSDDLCAKTACPIAPGPITINYVQDLPPIAPPVGGVGAGGGVGTGGGPGSAPAPPGRPKPKLSQAMRTPHPGSPSLPPPPRRATTTSPSKPGTRLVASCFAWWCTFPWCRPRWQGPPSVAWAAAQLWLPARGGMAGASPQAGGCWPFSWAMRF